MPKYGISRSMTGSPWHIERKHRTDPKDERRNRKKCAYYNVRTKHCSKQYALCIGAAHCKDYCTVENMEKAVSPKPSENMDEKLQIMEIISASPNAEKQNKQEPEKRYIKPQDISIGSIVTARDGLFLITSIRVNHELKYEYACKKVCRIKRKDVLSGHQNPGGKYSITDGPETILQHLEIKTIKVKHFLRGNAILSQDQISCLGEKNKK